MYEISEFMDYLPIIQEPIQEELAIHRKAIKKLLDRAGIVDAEFSEYYAVVEAAKVEVDENQQEHHN